MWLSMNEGITSPINFSSSGELESSLMDELMLPASSPFMFSGFFRAFLITFHISFVTSSGSWASTTPTFGKWRGISSMSYPSNVVIRAKDASNAVDSSCTALMRCHLSSSSWTVCIPLSSVLTAVGTIACNS